MKTQAEKEAAKAAKQAEKEAAKAAADSVEPGGDVQSDTPEVFSIDSEGVFVKKPQGGSKAEKMLQHLAVQSKVRFIVPLEGDEKPGKVLFPCIMNDLTINILKGVPVSLPEQVVKHLERCFQLTTKAERENESLLPKDGGPGKFLGTV